MFICYVDEAGCPGMLPSATSSVQPVLAISGVIIRVDRIPVLTQQFLKLKRDRYPQLLSPGADFLDSVLAEIKGSELRKQAIAASRGKRRRAIGFLEKTVDLLIRNHVSLFGRVWIKRPGLPVKSAAIYTTSIQRICKDFQQFLADHDDEGFLIADDRTRSMNRAVAHSVFTQKHQTAGDTYSRILEMPTFGVSDNHVGLQIADVVCSGLICPIAIHSYCQGHIQSIHVRPEYSQLKQRYAMKLMALQYRYQNLFGKWSGGLTVSDKMLKRSGGVLFR